MTVEIPQTRTRGIRRWLGRIALAVFLLLIVLVSALIVAFYSIDWNRPIALVTDEVKTATGRELKVKGDVTLGLFPPRAIIKDVSLANAPWGSRAVMFSAKEIDVSIRYAGLLRGLLELDFTMIGSDLLFEHNAKGISNWDLRGKSPRTSAAEGKSAVRALRVPGLMLRQAVVTYRSGPKAAAHRYALDELLIAVRTRPVVDVKLAADLNGSPVQLTGVIHDIDEFLRGRGPSPIELQGDVAGATVQAKGSIADPLGRRVVTVTMTARTNNLPAFGKMMREDLPALPPIEIDTQVQEKDRALKFSKFNLTVGDSSLAGDWTVDFRPTRSRIRGVVHGSSIDLPQLRASDEAGEKSKPDSGKGRIFSDRPWPTDALHAVDVALDVKVARLRATPKLLLNDVKATLNLSRGRLSVAPLTMPTVGGHLEARASLDTPAGRPAQLAFSAQGTGIDLGKNTAALGAGDLIIGGPTDVAIDLRGTGATPAAVAQTLNGYVRIVVGPGRVKNSVLLDTMGGVLGTVLKAINPFQEKATHSELQCLVVNVPVRGGVATVEHTVAFETDKIGVSSAGVVHIGKEEIDLAIKPKAKAVLDVGLADIAGMVRVRGPWAAPKVEVDPEGTAKSITKLWLDIATGGITLLADRLIFTPFVLDAPCKAALKKDVTTPAGTSAPASGG